MKLALFQMKVRSAASAARGSCVTIDDGLAEFACSSREASRMRVAAFAVEVAGWFVRHEESRDRLTMRARDGDSLLLAAGQLVG